MKKPGSKKSVRHDIFVLTPEEKRTIYFITIAFVLGLVTVHYRAAHAIPPSKIAISETATIAAGPAQKRAESKRPKPAN